MSKVRPLLDRRASPREARLAAWFREALSPVEVLFRAGAVHQRLPSVHADLRSTAVGAGDHTFPHPCDVGPLLAMLFDQLVAERWRLCRDLQDDLLMAAFAAHGVLAIHPFRDGNGRTAFDFATYLLMWRWGVAVAPLTLPDDVHAQVSGAARELDGFDVAPSFEGYSAIAARLQQHLGAGSSLGRLRGLAPLVAIAAALHGCLDSHLVTRTSETIS